MQAASEASGSAVGQLVVPPLQKVHSGGSRGGRPVKAPVRGQAAGFNTNRKQLGQCVLRRDPTASWKLAVIRQVEQLGSDPETLASHARRQVEKDSGFPWRIVLQWVRKKSQIQSHFVRLKLAQWGPRPFGSSLPLAKRGTQSLGARIQSNPAASYQSDVFKSLRQWFETERSYGHEVSTSMLRDFYIKFLERQSVVNKAKLLQISKESGSVLVQLQQLRDEAQWY